MAELVLSSLGQALGARLPGALGAIGATLGRVAGAALGGAIDNTLFGPRSTVVGPRLTDLHLQSSTEGASIPAVFGRVRIAGQVIWAARFKEHVSTTHAGGGKGGGPRVTSTAYSYSLSFAVGLCEGAIARIGRVWANGEAFDLSQASWRLHLGADDQAIDPLIETIEGPDAAPAYRGLAYIVFEDLPLEAFGNVIPQLSFEIVRPAPGAGGEARFEERVRGVCLIPGAGEFVYASEPVLRRLGPGQEAPENVHAERDRANLLVSLDQLQADFPNIESVLLVVAWFGDDLRCGACTIAPRIETDDKDTYPIDWRVSGVSRGDARIVSSYAGAPAFGGTPADRSVLQAIAELKARGLKVGLYPFLLMDVPAGNGLPDPYGAAEQAAYPWRGRVTTHPAAGHAGTPDKTGAATAQVSAFFGAAAPADFAVDDGLPTYAGPSDWSYRRLVLHYAKLAVLAGGVDVFVLGSELRGLTTARDTAANFPAVAKLQALAGDVRGMIGGAATLTYAADWSEYFGYQPQDGSGDVFFHLDPLWADANIDVIGVDWYPPLTDWRDGVAHLDADLAADVHDRDYLKSRIEAGEDYEWFYASDVDREAQTRTPIGDGAYGEPWIYRAKDLRNFWSRAHYNRPGGVRAASPTAWSAQSKPLWFIELGCPAVDKGANAPNCFPDAKSSESRLPPFSSGARDDLIQRRTLDAYLDYWDAGGPNNPVSTVTGAPMIGGAFLWCWDARPHPAFPARGDVWADAAAWRLGHWLSGRAGLSELGAVVSALCMRAGVEANVAVLSGAVSGYVADAPARARDLLEPLMVAYDFAVAERDGAITFFHPGADAVASIAFGDMSAAGAADPFAQRGDGADTPIEARVRFLDPGRDYLIGTVSARRLDRADGGVETLDAPLALEPEAAEAMARAILAERRAAAESIQIELGPGAIALEAGDRVSVEGHADLYDIVRIEDAETRRLELARGRTVANGQLGLSEISATPPAMAPTPAFCVLDLPLLPGFEADERPLAAVFASPWLGTHAIDAGPTLALATERGRVAQPAVMGELVWALWPGPVDRWDDGNSVRMRLYTGALASADADAVLNGANAFAVEADGEWEIIQARNCALAAPNEYVLSGLLRGCLGSAHAMQAPHPAGARIVLLDSRLGRIDVGGQEWGEGLLMICPPAGSASTDPRAASATATFPHAAARPWAPRHVRGTKQASGDIALSWVRCARVGGDSWGPGEPPLADGPEAYLLDILDGGDPIRTVTLSAPDHIYTAAQQTADFGGGVTSLRVRVAQLDSRQAPGLNTEATLSL